MFNDCPIPLQTLSNDDSIGEDGGSDENSDRNNRNGDTCGYSRSNNNNNNNNNNGIHISNDKHCVYAQEKSSTCSYLHFFEIHILQHVEMYTRTVEAGLLLIFFLIRSLACLIDNHESIQIWYYTHCCTLAFQLVDRLIYKNKVQLILVRLRSKKI
ncbi:hypothetical protein BDA99DRAFT_544181 [Phascolomyces articulosus]|uniref:Uncharacterized protein n=1 Tax=Phascolomyces articulosus TaxID=60185 RepID=A0AAD5P756_9FUNG|nr:hypothetical protein BDA99DRAFT_544181 [Phascolomyces articulosus]